MDGHRSAFSVQRRGIFIEARDKILLIAPFLRYIAHFLSIMRCAAPDVRISSASNCFISQVVQLVPLYSEMKSFR